MIIVWLLALVAVLGDLVLFAWALWRMAVRDVELASVDEFNDFRNALGGDA
jgi:hypothetical protein